MAMAASGLSMFTSYSSHWQLVPYFGPSLHALILHRTFFMDWTLKISLFNNLPFPPPIPPTSSPPLALWLPPCQPEEWSELINDLWDAPIDFTDHPDSVVEHYHQHHQYYRRTIPPIDSRDQPYPALQWSTSQGGRDRWRYATPPSHQ